jgi:GNAT superfamily N-acetyltransferase
VTYCAQSLTEHHELEAFDCQVESLNSWLRNEARRAVREGTAGTYVWTRENDNAVVAYFSIAPTLVGPDELSRDQTGGYSFPIPGYLLARLALDVELHGHGLGTQLLVDAISRMAGAAEISSGRLIVVDAIGDGAAAFYRKHDFVPVKGNPRRLILKIATARKAMGVTTN